MQVVSLVGGGIRCSVGSSADDAHATTVDKVAFLIQPDQHRVHTSVPRIPEALCRRGIMPQWPTNCCRVQ
jgi:hypothetical protein